MPFNRSEHNLPLCIDKPSKSHHVLRYNPASASRSSGDVGKSPTTDLQPESHNWPTDVEYLSRPIASPFLTESQKRWLYRKPQVELSTANKSGKIIPLPIIKLPLSRIEIDSRIENRLIGDKKHPAHGQRGLFAARDLPPGELVIPYIGYVHSSTASERNVWNQWAANRRCGSQDQQIANSETKGAIEDARHVHGSSVHTKHDTNQDPSATIGSWDTSSYDLNLHRDEDIELAIDGERMGNEARFCNDYRGVPASQIIDNGSDKWGRKAKRGAKTWSMENAGTGSPGGAAAGDGMEMAIPNAEFLDVWFEWPTENPLEAEKDQLEDRREDMSCNMAKLKINGDEQGSSDRARHETKHSRRQQRRRKAGMRGVAVFVMPAGKSNKRKHGIRAGQEILVSYGKGFWSHHGIEALDVSQMQSHHIEEAG